MVDLLNSRAYAIHPDKLDEPELPAPFGQDATAAPPERFSEPCGNRANVAACRARNAAG
ncbi:hypothetical protein [Kutzneria buriramensis]|uniref:Uncharacterized protein n=1 Tax=Kutzneria buriramensis TaxID=1045776 RepID=A0A3E0HKU0_9PSEU|nr:hypothetical protein [Kutzneria buriramensis]REH47112.1 hypothetical protein BCF44_106277 [Kutzneria buriramensis]